MSTSRTETGGTQSRSKSGTTILQSGDSVPIHTVGLDAPLYLLINLGYCRTPHGKGVLIHEGQKINKQGKCIKFAHSFGYVRNPFLILLLCFT